ncbi:only protein 42 [Seminavis robusta]|uniref:Only protein 42 n=1 Tax=Seminavis robusta TaxID=568900 RepID=A0A9N8DSJ6_9STRA|nr:only protein 42 [Seminavis robusta]|eukprot:Sro248_g098470.1 only protein 42 (361) ;mRNA; r:75834-76916
MSLKAEWIPMASSPSQRISPRRSGHTAFTTTTPSSTAFVFGGYIEEDPAKEGDMPFRDVRNDLWKWKDGAWQLQSPSGDIPGPRLATATACDNDNNKAYLFGGWDPQTPGTGGIILDTVHCLDLDSLEWNQLACTLPDGPTSRHVAVTLNQQNKILLHTFRCIDHVWIFDPNTQEFTQQATTGTSPGSLGLHTATMLDDTTLLVWGGATKDGSMTNRAFLLDTETWNWTPIAIMEEECPSARAGACLGTYSSTCAILFGGAETTPTGLNPKGDVWALHIIPQQEDNNNKNSDNTEGRWEKLLEEKSSSDDDACPEPRNAATLTPAVATGSADDCQEFLMTGGWAPFRQTWDDVFVLRLSE